MKSKRFVRNVFMVHYLVFFFFYAVSPLSFPTSGRGYAPYKSAGNQSGCQHARIFVIEYLLNQVKGGPHESLDIFAGFCLAIKAKAIMGTWQKMLSRLLEIAWSTHCVLLSVLAFRSLFLVRVGTLSYPTVDAAQAYRLSSGFPALWSGLSPPSALFSIVAA